METAPIDVSLVSHRPSSPYPFLSPQRHLVGQGSLFVLRLWPLINRTFGLGGANSTTSAAPPGVPVVTPTRADLQESFPGPHPHPGGAWSRRVKVILL